MSKFFDKLKKFMLEEFSESSVNACGYYETIMQNTESIQSLIDDCEKYYFDFNHSINPDGYSDGKIAVYLYSNDPGEDYGWQSSLDYHYEIDLLFDERMWGYCDCRPEDEGYNPIANCCGMGCDWTAPRVSISKHTGIGHFNFDGYERDLWNAEKKWGLSSDEYETEQKEKQKQQQMKWLDDQIKELEKRKEMILNEE
jgi:hypothetical protein